MTLTPDTVIYAMIFIAVLAVVGGVYLTIFGKSISLNTSVNRRLEMLEKGVGREEVLEQLRKEMTQHMSSRSIPIYSILADKAQKAALPISPQQILMLMGGGVIGGFYRSYRCHHRRASADPAGFCRRRGWRGLYLDQWQGQETDEGHRRAIARRG